MKRKKDIITQKNLDLERLTNKSNAALDLVTSTINNLRTINEEIDGKISEIETVKNSLEDTANGLMNTRVHNSKVIEKFKALIEV